MAQTEGRNTEKLFRYSVPGSGVCWQSPSLQGVLLCQILFSWAGQVKEGSPSYCLGWRSLAATSRESVGEESWESQHPGWTLSFSLRMFSVVSLSRTLPLSDLLSPENQSTSCVWLRGIFGELTASETFSQHSSFQPLPHFWSNEGLLWPISPSAVPSADLTFSFLGSAKSLTTDHWLLSNFPNFVPVISSHINYLLLGFYVLLKKCVYTH